MKKTLAVINTVIIAATIAFNSIASAGGINGNTVGGISDKYDTLFTPSGYAFAIWGIIYLALIAFAIFQLRRAFSREKESDFILQTGPWMTVANMANILWLYAWLNEFIGLSLVLMLVILVSLLILVIRLNMERWDAPFPIIAFVWWPICIYSGWIAVATIANVSSLLVSLEWQALLPADHADDHCGCPAEPAHDPAAQYAGVCSGGPLGSGSHLVATLGQHTCTSVDCAERCHRTVPGHRRAWIPQPGYRSPNQVQGILQVIGPSGRRVVAYFVFFFRL